MIARRPLESARKITSPGCVGSAFCVAVAVAASVAHGQTDADRVQAALETAATSLEAQRPRDALEALRSVQSLEPDNPWLWFYQGLAHHELGDWYPAMACFDRASDLLIALGDPDPALAASIRHYRDLARKQVFGLSLRVGLLYDSNVTFLGNAGAGFLITGRGDGKFASRFQLAYAPIADEHETFTVSARLSDTWHFDIQEFNDQDYGATFQYTRRLSDTWEAGIQYDYDIVYLNNEPYLSNHSLTPTLTYEWLAGASRMKPTRTLLFYRIASNDFLFPIAPVFDRDGFTNAVGIEQSFDLRPAAGTDWTWDLKAGYAFESVATEGSEFDRLDHLFFLSVAMPLENAWLPEKAVTVQLTANWQIADYRRDSVTDADGDERADVITAFDAVISQPLTSDPDRGDLTLHAIVGWSDAESNVRTSDGGTPFSYDKWVAGVQLEWSW